METGVCARVCDIERALERTTLTLCLFDRARRLGLERCETSFFRIEDVAAHQIVLNEPRGRLAARPSTLSTSSACVSFSSDSRVFEEVQLSSFQKPDFGRYDLKTCTPDHSPSSNWPAYEPALTHQRDSSTDIWTPSSACDRYLSECETVTSRHLVKARNSKRSASRNSNRRVSIRVFCASRATLSSFEGPERERERERERAFSPFVHPIWERTMESSDAASRFWKALCATCSPSS